MRIAKLVPSDAHNIAKLHIAAEQETYANCNPEYLLNSSSLAGRSQIWESALTDPAICAFAVWVNNIRNPVGVISGRVNDAAGSSHRHAYLGSIYVLRRFQRCGIGTALMTAFLKELTKKRVLLLSGKIPLKSCSGREFFSATGFAEYDMHVDGDTSAPFKSVNIKLTNIELILKNIDSSYQR